MQQAITQDIWQEDCQLLGLVGDGRLTAVHLQEIETEAENVLLLASSLFSDNPICYNPPHGPIP